MAKVLQDSDGESRTTILDQAKALIYGDREKAYGSPRVNHRRIARLWSAYLDVEISAFDVAILMILVKVSRLRRGYHEDSLIDGAGYFAIAHRIVNDPEED